MAIYELTTDGIETLSETRFADLGIKERQDLQRILRDHVGVVSPDTMVLAEEFGDFEESRRLGAPRRGRSRRAQIVRLRESGLLGPPLGPWR